MILEAKQRFMLPLKSKTVPFVFVFLTLAFLSSCVKPETYYHIHGSTQGTYYNITYSSADSVNFQPEIDSILHSFDLSLSTYIEESLISGINNNTSDSIDYLIQRVLEVSKEVHQLSNGAFDITIMPLIEAWGFHGGEKRVLAKEEIDSLLQRVGMDKIKIHEHRIQKANPDVRLDVNAIAQGYSVDIACEFLDGKGISNYLVEIGGELRTKGINSRGVDWIIGIDKPEYGNFIPGMNMQQKVQLGNLSLATSGNYRSYFEVDGKKYTHSFDPETGMPAVKNILSASIVCKDCIYADALATACMVMGYKDGLEMINNIKDTEAYLVYSDEDGRFQVACTDGFKNILID